MEEGWDWIKCDKDQEAKENQHYVLKAGYRYKQPFVSCAATAAKVLD